MLTAQQFACGYVQRKERKGIAVTLWLEHGVYHVRAHDHGVHERLEWQVGRTLKQAITLYRAICAQWLPR